METLGEEEASIRVENRPTPDNFDLFIPWACRQFQLNLDIEILNVLCKVPDTKHNARPVTLMAKKSKVTSEVLDDKSSSHSISLKREPLMNDNENKVKIVTMYDNNGNLKQLKFDQNKKVPRQVLQIISLIVDFHKQLTCISVNRGLNAGFLQELNHLQSISNITDICLDNTHLANDFGYEMLLEKKSNLRHLSISRCQLNDQAVEKIALKLIHPLPASLPLSLLNLASNFITDKGAKYLALALRTNRILVYLNISDNSIGDEGAAAILDILGEFPISHNEIVEARARYLQYIREKEALTAGLVIKLKSEDLEKKNTLSKKRPTKLVTVSTCSTSPIRKLTETDEADLYWLERAKLIAEKEMGEFMEPLSPKDIETKNGIEFCKGNNHMAYINFSYNNLTYLSIKKILSVLKCQRAMNRKPRGLANISIEGNCFPTECPELREIDTILMSYFPTVARRMSMRMSMASSYVPTRGKK